MKRFFIYTLLTILALRLFAGYHTVQRGETFRDIALLYGVTEDTLRSLNGGDEPYAGYAIDIPSARSYFDVGESSLFRLMKAEVDFNPSKASKLFEKAEKLRTKSYENGRVPDEKKLSKITKVYEDALKYGSNDAAYRLGLYYVTGSFRNVTGYLSESSSLNNSLPEFKTGLEYLQVAGLNGNNSALVQMAMLCLGEDSPIYNPYLCVGMLETFYKKNIYRGGILGRIFEEGIGVPQNLLDAYLYCGDQELHSRYTSHKEEIIARIDSMPQNAETVRYGNGLDSDLMMQIGLSHYDGKILDREGLFWLHRAALKGEAEAAWALAGVIANGKFPKGAVGDNKDYQSLYFARMAASGGHKEASEYVEKYEAAERERQRIAEQRREAERLRREQEKRERTAAIIDLVGRVVNTAVNAYAISQNQSSYSPSPSSSYSTSTTTPLLSMSDAQFAAHNQLALTQIMQYTYNKGMADWYGVPMVPTDMSAVNLGSDMSVGSPMWQWGMQQQINTIATQNTRMEAELLAYYHQQADYVTQCLINNPLAPIPGIVDIDGNWVSREMIEAENYYGNATGYGTGHNHSSSQTDVVANFKEYNRNHYGDKQCSSCMGHRTCKFCNGNRRVLNNLTGEYMECPNCWIEGGRRTGLCGKCGGKGTVFGIR